ncbi:ComEC/Rec2 family competence protein, partial [uncultured Stenotrophomonas sp.]|uniref:ComEC/Rec2 family competence protein n=1 Tax=uncultured Stenotrophomonas sp. TaxID=165438 RepID=UPI0028D38CD4
MTLPLFGKATAAALLGGICMVVFAPRLLPAALAGCALLLGVPLWCGWARGRWCGAVLVGLGWAAVQAHAALDVQLPAGAPATLHMLRGRVVDLPQHGPRSTRFRFRVDDDPAMPARLRGRELVLSWHDGSAVRTPTSRHAVQAGARWQLQARLRPPRGLRNPGGFDAERHALWQRLAGTGQVRAPARALG